MFIVADVNVTNVKPLLKNLVLFFQQTNVTKVKPLLKNLVLFFQQA
jgi:hypothetical protein